MIQPLTTDQIRSFDNDGYLVLRRWIPDELLKRLRRGVETAVQRGVRDYLNNSPDNRVAILPLADRPYVIRINDLIFDQDPVFFELLGSPFIADVARELSGHDSLPTYEALVMKNRGDNNPIVWHRDMMHSRTGRVFTLGVYLDESARGSGALRLIPASQTSPDDVCELSDKLEAGLLTAIEIDMEPGDVLIHDVMVLHASGLVTHQAFRRTIYFEFRPEDLVRANPHFSSEWIVLRRRLLELAQKRWSGEIAIGAGEWSGEEQELIAQLKVARATIEAGHYCYRPVSN